MFGKNKREKETLKSLENNFASYSDRIFSNDEGLKDKAKQELVEALEDGKLFYLADNIWFRCVVDSSTPEIGDIYVFEFSKDGKEPFTDIDLNAEEFKLFFDYAVAVREGIFSNICLTKEDNSFIINIGKNLSNESYLTVTKPQNKNKKTINTIEVNILSEHPSMFIKLIHAMIYAKYFTQK